MSFSELKNVSEYFGHYQVTGTTDDWVKIIRTKTDVKGLDFKNIFDIVHVSKKISQPHKIFYDDVLTYVYNGTSKIRIAVDEIYTLGTMYDVTTSAEQQTLDSKKLMSPHEHFILNWLFGTKKDSFIRNLTFEEIICETEPKWHFGLLMLQYQDKICWSERAKAFEIMNHCVIA